MLCAKLCPLPWHGLVTCLRWSAVRPACVEMPVE